MYSRHVDASDHLSESPKKKRRQLTHMPVRVAEQFRGIASSAVSVTSHLLQGKEFCVLSAWNKLTKKDIETKIVQNGGTVVQNPGTFVTKCFVMLVRLDRMPTQFRTTIPVPDTC